MWGLGVADAIEQDPTLRLVTAMTVPVYAHERGRHGKDGTAKSLSRALPAVPTTRQSLCASRNAQLWTGKAAAPEGKCVRATRPGG